MRIILGQFRQSLGWVPAIIVLIGVIAAFRSVRRDYGPVFLIAFPVLFTLYMSTTTALYHRNFVQLYPFVVIFFAYGGYALHRLALGNRLLARHAAARFIVVGSVVIALAPMSYMSAKTALRGAHGKDTRTQAVSMIGPSADGGDIVVAADLHIHPRDLARLPGNHREMPIADLVADMCAANPGHRRYIVPYRRDYTDFGPATVEQAAAIARQNRLFAALRQRNGVVSLGGDQPTPTWAPIVNPGILLVTAEAGLCDGVN